MRLILGLLLLTTACLGDLHWDYMIFAQQWTGTFCNFNPCISKPVDQDFTIHGLWPTQSPEKEPTKCPAAPAFNERLLSPIMDNLRRYWPDLLSKAGPVPFWILANAGIKPNNAVLLKRDDVIQAVNNVLNVRSRLSCLQEKNKPAQLLEVRVCVDPKLELINCNANDVEDQLGDFSHGSANAISCPSEFTFPVMN
ncbi:unnamed protein product [Echinostoma caproni]|uniref:Ribonuclease T(2) n=1 Tax=Echinostoma caproni TaxID=27848 RepID=A0A183AX81_9TREM|nr:unnamed protein product [Echinostoma caproni]